MRPAHFLQSSRFFNPESISEAIDIGPHGSFVIQTSIRIVSYASDRDKICITKFNSGFLSIKELDSKFNSWPSDEYTAGCAAK